MFQEAVRGSSRKTESVEEQIMSRDKQSCIFPSQIVVIVFINPQILTRWLSSKRIQDHGGQIQISALNHSATLFPYAVLKISK